MPAVGSSPSTTRDAAASGRAADVNRYAPEACVRDIMDACAALHIHQAVVIGTSFGGLLGMGLAAARPGLVRAVVLNDIGPDIGTDGADFVRDFVALDPALESLDACVAFLRADLPPMSLDTDAAWRRMAELTYQSGPRRTLAPALGYADRAPSGCSAARPVDLVRRLGTCSCPAGSRRGQQHPVAGHGLTYAGDPPGYGGRDAPRYRPRADPD